LNGIAEEPSHETCLGALNVSDALRGQRHAAAATACIRTALDSSLDGRRLPPNDTGERREGAPTEASKSVPLFTGGVILGRVTEAFAKPGRSTYAPRKPSARVSRTANCHSLSTRAGAELPDVTNNFPVREAGDDIHSR
jgi:hypothetical protein